jgi:hypothetical protein
VHTIYSELELAGRVPGERIELTRQQHDAALSDLREIARAICELSEQRH